MWQTILDPELLISLIENRPIIWDKSLESYKDKHKRAAAWREVCIILKDDFESMEEEERQNYAKNVVKKWNHIRDSWWRSLNANKNTKKSGSVFVKKYRYYKQLLFLKKIIQPTETSDNANNSEMYQDDTDVDNSELENSISQNEEVEHVPSLVNESPMQDNPSSAKRFKRSDAPRQKINVVDHKVMSYLEHQIKTRNDSQNEERYMSFFKSLLPSVALLNDDQILQFYAGVISLLQNIKSNDRNQWPNEQQSTSNYSYQSPQGYFTPRYGQSSPSATSVQSSLQIDDQPSATEMVIKSERDDCASL